MATLLFLLLATFVATFSAVQGQQCTLPPTIATACTNAAQALRARDDCCDRLGKQGHCLCPAVNQLKSEGVPLGELCQNYSGCGPSPPAGGGSCQVPTAMSIDCTNAAQGLKQQANCCTGLANQSACFCAAVNQLSRNGVAIEALCPSASSCPKTPNY